MERKKISMSIRIGHSSIDENFKIAGGLAGDQTKKEVCIRPWYEHKNGWDVVLRPRRIDVAEKSASFVEGICRNNYVGYDQGQRNSLYYVAKKVDFQVSQINESCECDCSSLLHCAAIAAGANLDYGNNAETTRTMRKAFLASGDYDELTALKYLSMSRYLRRGDILLAEGSHTAIVLENGSRANGGGNRQYLLEVDGEWGKDTTRKSQIVFATIADGIVSNQLSSCIKYVPNVMTSSWEFHEKKYGKGSLLIAAIQKLVIAEQDGYCGKETVSKMQIYLKERDIYMGKIDGIMGEKTVKAWQIYINMKL